jgi:hypothetical protein
LSEIAGGPSRGPISDSSIAFLNLVNGDIEEAVNQASQVTLDSDLPHANILASSVMLMAGADKEAQDLASTALRSDDRFLDDWGGLDLDEILRYIAEERTDTDLLKQLSDRRDGNMLIHWAVACRALGRDNRPLAIKHYQACLDQGIINQAHHWWARAMLRTLSDPQRSWPDTRE